MPTIDWTDELADQLDVHWTNQLRPRLSGLTDDEYFWEPVADTWSVRPASGGGYTIDFAYPPPSPEPVTTIAWRLGHLIVGVFGMRAASHFGGPPMSYETFGWARTADEALKQLDDAYGSWMRGVRGLDAEGLARPCGPAEGP